MVASYGGVINTDRVGKIGCKSADELGSQRYFRNHKKNLFASCQCGFDQFEIDQCLAAPCDAMQENSVVFFKGSVNLFKCLSLTWGEFNIGKIGFTIITMARHFFSFDGNNTFFCKGIECSRRIGKLTFNIFDTNQVRSKHFLN